MKYFPILLLIPSIAIGQSITGISGIVADSDSVTITGTSFGNNGPNVLLFDNYEGGTAGQSTTNAAVIGTWQSTGAGQGAQFVADDVGSNMAANVIGPWCGDVNNIKCDQKFVLPNLTNTVYVSHKLKVPDGSRWPTSGAEERFPNSEENWHWGKFMKMYDYETGFSATDDDYNWQIVWADNWSFGSADNPNNSNPEPDFGPSDPWSWDNWNRCDVFLGGGSSPRASDGNFLVSFMSEEGGQWHGGFTNIRVFDGQDRWNENLQEWMDNNIDQWTLIHFNGQFSQRGIPYDAAWELWIDDVYLATGPGARARVEIGNNAVYANCTKLDISTPTSWSNTSISVVVRLSQFTSNDAAYLFVIDESGQASAGFEVTIGGGVNENMEPPTGASITGGG